MAPSTEEMSRTERIARHVVLELGRYSDFIDLPDVGLRSIQITIKVGANGVPRAVIVSTECGRDYEREARSG